MRMFTAQDRHQMNFQEFLFQQTSIMPLSLIIQKNLKQVQGCITVGKGKGIEMLMWYLG